ncbi:MAG: helix-turn-helix domain-containing protein [Lachnospiraceae bacterium]|nr:helix-turn-helix domain-containing protein [Lachnospiraceae bacterium]
MKKIDGDKFYIRVGRRIQKVRCEKNLTREDVARNTNISVKFLYEIESGTKGFNVNILYKIAKELDVSCDYLLGYCSIGRICQEQCMDDVITMFDKDELPNVRKVLDILCQFSELRQKSTKLLEE